MFRDWKTIARCALFPLCSILVTTLCLGLCLMYKIDGNAEIVYISEACNKRLLHG